MGGTRPHKDLSDPSVQLECTPEADDARREESQSLWIVPVKGLMTSSYMPTHKREQ